MTDWASATSATAAAAGLVFTGWQVRTLRKDRQEERRLETEGVSVSWHPKIRPNETDVDRDGLATWHYVVQINNPGRFPISDIRVFWKFEVKVTRMEHGGVPRESTQLLTLHQPVLAGGGHREWNRRLRIRFKDRDGLHHTSARIEFRDADGNKHFTTWPKTT